MALYLFIFFYFVPFFFGSNTHYMYHYASVLAYQLFIYSFICYALNNLWNPIIKFIYNFSHWMNEFICLRIRNYNWEKKSKYYIATDTFKVVKFKRSTIWVNLKYFTNKKFGNAFKFWTFLFKLTHVIVAAKRIGTSYLVQLKFIPIIVLKL